MNNRRRVLRQSWRGEGGRKVIDFKSDGKTHWSQEEAANPSQRIQEPQLPPRIMELILSQN